MRERVTDSEAFTIKLPTVPPPPECRVDADCPEGYVCRDGVCVEAPPPTPFPWVEVLGPLLAGLFIAGLTKASGRRSAFRIS